MSRSFAKAEGSQGRTRSLSGRMDALRTTLVLTRGKPLRERLAGFEDLFPHLFKGINLRNEDLSGQDLRGMDFSYANLTGAKFDNARIDGARFWQARVRRAQLQQASDWQAFARSWAPSDKSGTAGSLSGDRILMDPLGPEFIVLDSPGLNAERPEGVDPDTWDVWRDGRLAVARTPLTVWEARAANARLENTDLSKDLRPALLAPDAVHDYLKWLQGRMGASVQVPALALWVAIARQGGVPTMPGRDWAITADAAIDRTEPEPVPQGDGIRTNGFGLVDMIGNVREFVRATDGRLLAVGGSFTDSLSTCLDGVENPVVPDRAVGLHLGGLRLIFRFRPRGEARGRP